jgi:glycosyltransferase involved in cell wall biosynthesis
MLDAAGRRIAHGLGALKTDMVAGLDEEKIRVHYTGLDRARFHPRTRIEARRGPRQAEPRLPTDAPLFVCPGALIAIKGQALAIDALAIYPALIWPWRGQVPTKPPCANKRKPIPAECISLVRSAMTACLC